MSADKFVSTLQSGLKTLAEQQLKQYGSKAVNIAMTSGLDFFTRHAIELADWKKQVLDGSMDEDDLRWLIQSKKDLVNLEALKAHGLAKVALDRFINGVVDVIILAAKAAP
jgi:hypothetical protein